MAAYTVRGESPQHKPCRRRASLALHLTLHGHHTHDGIILVVPCTSLLVRCTVEGLVRSDYAAVEVVNGDLTLRRTFQLDQKPFEPPAITLYLQQTVFQQCKQRGAGIVVHFCIIAHVSLSVCFDYWIFQSYSR